MERRNAMFQSLLLGGNGGAAPVMREAFVTPTEETQYVLPGEGYDGLSKVTVDPIPSEYIVPSGTLNISSNGAFDVANYASASVNVSGGASNEDAIIARTIVNLSNTTATAVGASAFAYATTLKTVYLAAATSIGSFAFRACSSLTTISFPSVTTIGSSAFTGCTNLANVSLPELTIAGDAAFSGCTALTGVYLPKLKSVPASCFMKCTSLATVSFPAASWLDGFSSCGKLLSVYLLGSSKCRLNGNPFYQTPISNSTASTGGVHGSVFVPESLYSEYIADGGWSVYSERIVSLTDAQIEALG